MTSTVNRRTFLGAAAAAATTGVATSTARAAGANDRVVVGVMGLSRGRSLSVSFAGRPNVEVKYVCDVDSAVRAGEKLRSRVGGDIVITLASWDASGSAATMSCTSRRQASTRGIPPVRAMPSTAHSHLVSHRESP